MPMRHMINSSTSSFQQSSSSYLERPRLHKLLEDAVSYPMVTVCAGSGFGKTRALYSFLQKYDAHTTWIQISERDNVGTRFWESFVHMISLSWPEAGARFLEIGFPDSEKAFTRFDTMMQEASEIPGKHVMVYDDFHLFNNPTLLRFLEKAFSALPPKCTVILLSRTMPEINITGMMLRERVFTIHEDDLRFTEDEIAEYFKQLELPISRQDLRDIYDDTRGWTFAVNLIGRSLRKEARYERHALEAMKENIFKLIETEISKTFSDPLWNLLLRISLIDNHAASLIRSLVNDNALIFEMERLNAYIRYDSHMGAYMIHHLLLDYLRQYHHMLSAEEKKDTYNKAGIWCENNDYQVDAITYYEKSGDFDAILRIVYTFKFQMSPNLARYLVKVFNLMPSEVAARNPLFPAMYLKLKISLGQLDEASALAEQYVREYESRAETPDKNRALAEIYGAWALLRTIVCPYTDVYDFDEYCEKQRMYYDKNPYTAHASVTNLSIGSYALLVGSGRAGAPEEYIDAMSRAVSHVSYMFNGSLYGLDDLARGELFYFQRELNSAEQYLKKSLDKARARHQYDIQNRSLIYLMLISFSRGDIRNANNVLQQMESLLDAKDYTTRYEAHDIARSHYHLALCRPDEIADWLKGDFSPFAHPAFMENYANRIKAQYRYMTNQYNELLAFLENVRESQTLLIGKIVFRVLEALSLYQLKGKDEAISVLSEAYAFAEPNRIIVPFTQFAKDMRTLTAAAMKDDNCSIPRDWLENVNRKASAFARRRAHLISENNAENDINNGVSLTKRESEILKDLSQGLSRTEIAASQNISVNTVKMNINIIYEKLHANNLVNAVRIATDRGII